MACNARSSTVVSVIYDRPVWQLMQEAADELSAPYSVAAVIAWFRENYPAVRPTTVGAHVRGMTANDPSRRHYPGLAAKAPLFFRTESRELIRFDHQAHGGERRLALVKPAVENSDQSVAGSAEFTLGDHLGLFLAVNWEALDWGRPLRIWEGPDGESGIGLNTTGGRLDFLCCDTATNALVVIKVRGDRRPETVIGEVAQHVGWVRVHLAAPGQEVEGIIVADIIEDPLRYAISTVPGLSVVTYRVTFELRTAEAVRKWRRDGPDPGVLSRPTWGW